MMHTKPARFVLRNPPKYTTSYEYGDMPQLEDVDVEYDMWTWLS